VVLTTLTVCGIDKRFFFLNFKTQKACEGKVILGTIKRMPLPFKILLFRNLRYECVFSFWLLYKLKEKQRKNRLKGQSENFVIIIFRKDFILIFSFRLNCPQKGVAL
jgi:hypothetical protein